MGFPQSISKVSRSEELGSHLWVRIKFVYDPPPAPYTPRKKKKESGMAGENGSLIVWEYPALALGCHGHLVPDTWSLHDSHCAASSSWYKMASLCLPAAGDHRVETPEGQPLATA